MFHILGLSIWLRLFLFILGLVLGFWLILRPLYIVSIVGKMPWAEQKLGPGGTYSAVKLCGILLIVVGVIVLINF